MSAARSSRPAAVWALTADALAGALRLMKHPLR